MPVPLTAAQARLPALDWMRGLVMVLMALDHASDAFNSGRLLTDATFIYAPGTPLPALQFMVRWVTHLCAPTFLFLAGTSLALSIEKRLRAGESQRSLDGFIAKRGLLIMALDPLWMSWAWYMPNGELLLQVLFAIGGSLVLMVGLRRLGERTLLVLALATMVLHELLANALISAFGMNLVVGFLLTGGVFGKLIVGYPVLPWTAIMALGWVFGRWLLAREGEPERPRRTRRLLLATGLPALAVFVVVRGLNAYGNAGLLRDDGSIVQWLHVSKYPPSITFCALELGLMALALVAFLWLQDRGGPEPAWMRPLHLFGQTAFFFYLLHVHLLELAAWALGKRQAAGLPETFIATAAVLLVLLPLCRWYRGYKAAHPNGWPRYI